MFFIFLFPLYLFELLAVMRQVDADTRARGENTGAPKSFKSEHYNLPEGFLTLPRPYKKDIPFFIGGHSKYALKRAATLGNGWLPQQSALSIEPSKLIEPIELMRKEAVSVGKDPKKLKKLILHLEVLLVKKNYQIFINLKKDLDFLVIFF